MLGGDPTLASLLWMLVCVVLIVGRAYWVTRYVAGRGALGAFQGGRRMEVLDRLPLGRDQSVILAQLPLGREQKLLVAQAGERYFLLGVTASRIDLLAELTEEEAASWKKETAEERPGFKEAFFTVLKQRERR